MTEKQDTKITKHFNTSIWYYLGDKDNWKIYETCNGDLFAISKISEKVSFEVYHDEDEEFIIY